MSKTAKTILCSTAAALVGAAWAISVVQTGQPSIQFAIAIPVLVMSLVVVLVVAGAALEAFVEYRQERPGRHPKFVRRSSALLAAFIALQVAAPAAVEVLPAVGVEAQECTAGNRCGSSDAQSYHWLAKLAKLGKKLAAGVGTAALGDVVELAWAGFTGLAADIWHLTSSFFGSFDDWLACTQINGISAAAACNGDNTA